MYKADDDNRIIEEPVYTDTPIPRRDSRRPSVVKPMSEKDKGSASSEDNGRASSGDSSIPRRGALRPPKNGLDFGRNFKEEYPGLQRQGRDFFAGWQPAAPGRDVPIPDMLKMLIDTFDQRDLAPARKPAAFYRQACMMSAYEDDYVYSGEFNQYFPIYQNMNAEQLCGYFGWRTRLRRGNYTDCPASFVFLYLYEIINKIGYDDPRQGLKTLEEVMDYYSEKYSRLRLFRTKWIRDYIICYNLPEEDALRYFSSLIGTDQSLEVLNHYQTKESKEIFDALCKVASYPLQNSAFYKKRPEDCIRITAKIYGRLSEFYQEHYYRTLAQRIFGLREKYPYRMFESALYLERGSEEDYSYQIGTARTYRRHKGRWTCERYQASGSQPTELNAILRESDRQMRDAFEIRPPLKKHMYSYVMQELIAQTIEEYKQELAEAARPKVHIDLSLLSGIRKDADYTRDQLLEGTEDREEYADEQTNSPNVSAGSVNIHTESAEVQTDSSIIQTDSADTVVNPAPYALSSEEVFFLRLLLEGKPWQDFIRTKHLLVSVLCDSINEKLFDEFQDTVIDMDQDLPVLVEDYRDDLQDLLN